MERTKLSFKEKNCIGFRAFTVVDGNNRIDSCSRSVNGNKSNIWNNFRSRTFHNSLDLFNLFYKGSQRII